jgi:hypothetical protein
MAGWTVRAHVPLSSLTSRNCLQSISDEAPFLRHFPHNRRCTTESAAHFRTGFSERFSVGKQLPRPSFFTLSIDQGAAAVVETSTNPDAIVIYLDGLSIDTANDSWLDVANNEIYIDYGTGPDPIASIRQDLALGYNQGYWNGPAGISSSSANSNSRFALGFADAADPAGLSSGEIKIMYTLYGDADLNGIVNGTDFSILAAHFGLGATNWDEGDFNYGSSVNGTDFSLLAENFGQGI